MCLLFRPPANFFFKKRDYPTKNIRPLSKVTQLMIVYPGNQIEPQSESTPSVPVPVTQYPKPFQHTEYVFHGDPLS